MIAPLAAALVAASSVAAEPALARPLSADDCVELALRGGQVKEAEAKVREWRARLAEVEAIFYPKLEATAFAAPMFRVRGSPLAADVERDYGEWGPYLHLEATLAQPLYTFGRAAAGEKAAAERVAVEAARLRQVRNTVAHEVRRFYYLHLYAKSLRPSLESARKILDGALETAREEHARGSGKVTNVDVQKLTFGSAELDRYRIQARVGEELALAALKHTMALPPDAALALRDEELPPPPSGPLPALADALRVAARRRPEWAQLAHGREAALSLAEAERLANAPVVFAAGRLGADWTPMRPDARSPYLLDEYNDLSGGVAIGLRFELDPARAAARADAAGALREQVDALGVFAATGIPLEVRKARDELAQAAEVLAAAERGAVAARKWLLFAGAAFTSGTGEADDVLEGLAAHLSAKRTQLESLRDLHLARSALWLSAGLEAGGEELP